MPRSKKRYRPALIFRDPAIIRASSCISTIRVNSRESNNFVIHYRPHHYAWFPCRMLLLLLGVAWLGAGPGVATEIEDRWWPTQLMPKAIIRTTNQLHFPEPRFAFQAMMQSVAGLAAKAVNN